MMNDPNDLPGGLLEMPLLETKKYIQIQGFAKLDKEDILHFLINKEKKIFFAVSAKDAVSRDIFRTVSGDKFVYFASVLIPHSDGWIKTLQEGTNQTLSAHVSCPCENCFDCYGNDVVKPPTGSVTGQPDLPFVVFLTKVVRGGQLVELIHYAKKQ